MCRLEMVKKDESKKKMGRPAIRLVLSKEEEDILTFVKENSIVVKYAPDLVRRCDGLLNARGNIGLREAAKSVSSDITTMNKWVKSFSDDGMYGLLDISFKNNNNPYTGSQDIREKLQKEVESYLSDAAKEWHRMNVELKKGGYDYKVVESIRYIFYSKYKVVCSYDKRYFEFSNVDKKKEVSYSITFDIFSESFNTTRPVGLSVKEYYHILNIVESLGRNECGVLDGNLLYENLRKLRYGWCKVTK